MRWDKLNNLHVALVNEKANKTLIDANHDKFKQHLTFDKPVERLYSHPTCLYILFEDNTFGYIPLEKTNSEKMKDLETKVYVIIHDFLDSTVLKHLR